MGNRAERLQLNRALQMWLGLLRFMSAHQYYDRPKIRVDVIRLQFQSANAIIRCGIQIRKAQSDVAQLAKRLLIERILGQRGLVFFSASARSVAEEDVFSISASSKCFAERGGEAVTTEANGNV